MSITTAIQSAQTKVAAVYTKCNEMHATMPAVADQDLAHLPDCIDTIGEVQSKDIDFIDIDGKFLYSFTRQEALALTELPALPTREGLVCEGWNWTLQEIKDQCNAHMKASIGPLYHTVSGKDEFVWENYCAFKVKGAAATIDWGDGSQPQSAEIDEVVEHSSYGRFRASISFANSSGYFHNQTESTAYPSKYIYEYYSSGNNNVPVFVYGRCTIFGMSENSTQLSGTGRGAYNSHIKNVVFQRVGKVCMFEQTHTYIEKYCFPGRGHVRSVPYQNEIFSWRIDFPVNDGDHYVGESFYLVPCIKWIDFPAHFTSINANAVMAGSLLKYIIVRGTTPPTLGASFWAYTRIFVPYSADHSVLNAYKTATNWINYANQIYELDANGEIPQNS